MEPFLAGSGRVQTICQVKRSPTSVRADFGQLPTKSSSIPRSSCSYPAPVGSPAEVCTLTAAHLSLSIIVEATATLYACHAWLVCDCAVTA